jgi:hypothetical protein
VSELVVRVSDEEPPILWYAYQYDDAGDLVAARDRAGGTTRYAYADHLLVEDRNRDGYAFFFAYDAERRCIRTWGQDGYLTRDLHFDRENRRTRVVNGEGEQIVYRYTAAGVVEHTERAEGFCEQTVFDDAGRPVARMIGTAVLATMQYNDEGSRRATARYTMC